MGENPYKGTERLLRSYPALCTARKNLEQELEAAASLLGTYSFRHGEGEAEAEPAMIGDHILDYERRSVELNLLRARIDGIERALGALPEVDRKILHGFFIGTYTKETPFDLMEELGYEKSQLYRKRRRALAQFELNYSGRLPEG